MKQRDSYLTTVFSLFALCVCGHMWAQELNDLPYNEMVMLEEEMKTDSIPLNSLEEKKSNNIFKKIGEYFKQSNKEVEPGKFDITFIGGPHYSEEKQFGIGLLAAGVYRPDYETPPSNVSLFGDVATVGFYEIGIMGNHISRRDASRINYQVYFYSFPCYFWGVGFDNAFDNDNKTKYSKLQAQIIGEWLFRVYPGLYLGPSVEFSYISATKRSRPEPWDGYRPTTFSYGVGGTFSYDTRDNLTAPTKGMYGVAAVKAYPGFLFNKDAFANIELTYNFYKSVWKGGILAIRVHGMFSIGKNIPWGMLPSFGGSYNMRGYYAGRYCDRNEADITFELRQHVWRRNGIAVWLGAGEVFPSFKEMHFNQILPSWGVGYRWEFKKNINIRMDLGFGRKSSNFIFSINEAF